jgi:hypothetical protein
MKPNYRVKVKGRKKVFFLVEILLPSVDILSMNTTVEAIL